MIHQLVNHLMQQEAEERRQRLCRMAGWLLFAGFVGLCLGYAWRVVQVG